MKTPRRRTPRLAVSLLAAAIGAFAPMASHAQYAPPVYAPPPPPAPSVYAPPAAPAFSQSLDGMLAPVALYPDPLLSQILVAATYPREVIDASRWLRSNPGWAGDAAVAAAASARWDPSVQALCAFPQVLAMMEQNAQWTEELGEAFLESGPQVMDTVQALRQRAWAQGTLRSTPYQNVYSQGPLIIIVPAQPQVVYVPYYDPLVVYGRWWQPVAPVRWNPWPGYVVRSGAFAWGPAIRISTGRLAVRFDWPRQVVSVARPGVPARVWVHEADHRRGEPYRVEVVRERFARAEPMREPRREVRPQERRDDARREDERRDDRRDERRGTRDDDRHPNGDRRH